ncbi:MAG: aldo/keto reductase [Thermoanaerobaculia bacterium]
MSGSGHQGVPHRELGRGYAVPRLISGGWQLSQGHRQIPLDPDGAVRQLRRLVEAGLTTFDCGDIYIGVEELLGRLLRDTADVRVHTKLVPDREELPRIDRRYVERIIDRSLRRLGVERLDLVQLHWWDYQVPGYVETALWLDEQRRAGKIRLLGATNFDVPRLTELLEAGVPLVAHQVQYSLIDRRPERGMVGLCREHGLQLLAYGTLAGGFLTRRYLGRPAPAAPLTNRSLVKYRLMLDELGGWDRFQGLLGTLAVIADRHGVSIANVAVRWTLDRAGVAAAIVGAFDAGHLEDNLRVFDLEMDEEDLRRLESFADAGPPGDVYAAERVPEGRHAAIMRYDLNREGRP